MSLTITKVEVDGVEYHVQALPATEGACIMAKVMSCADPESITALFAMDADTRSALLTSDDETLAMVRVQAVMSIVRSLGEEMVHLLKRMLATTTANKVQIPGAPDFDGSAQITGGNVPAEWSIKEHFDTHFQGRYMHMFSVFVAVGSALFKGP